MMYDRQGQRRKQTTNCALRALHCRATPTEDCGQGAQGVRTSVQQYNVRTTGHEEPRTYRKDRHGAEIGDGGDGLDGAMAMAKANANANMNVDVDILGGGLTSLRAPPSLSEPHDQPYPMQPYATKPSQFHNFTNCDTTPYKFPTVSAGDSAMGRGMPCQGHRTTVRPYNSTVIQCTTYDKYNA